MTKVKSYLRNIRSAYVTNTMFWVALGLQGTVETDVFAARRIYLQRAESDTKKGCQPPSSVGNIPITRKSGAVVTPTLLKSGLSYIECESDDDEFLSLYGADNRGNSLQSVPCKGAKDGLDLVWYIASVPPATYTIVITNEQNLESNLNHHYVSLTKNGGSTRFEVGGRPLSSNLKIHPGETVKFSVCPGTEGSVNAVFTLHGYRRNPDGSEWIKEASISAGTFQVRGKDTGIAVTAEPNHPELKDKNFAGEFVPPYFEIADQKDGEWSAKITGFGMIRVPYETDDQDIHSKHVKLATPKVMSSDPDRSLKEHIIPSAPVGGFPGASGHQILGAWIRFAKAGNGLAVGEVAKNSDGAETTRSLGTFYVQYLLYRNHSYQWLNLGSELRESERQKHVAGCAKKLSPGTEAFVSKFPGGVKCTANTLKTFYPWFYDRDSGTAPDNYCEETLGEGKVSDHSFWLIWIFDNNERNRVLLRKLAQSRCPQSVPIPNPSK